MSADEAVAESSLDTPQPRGHRRVRAGLRKPSNWLQLVRFAVVGASGYVVNLVVLHVLVELGVNKVLAQAIAIVLVTPLNFVGNKLWSFGRA